jgi:hypothetical protein
MAQVEGCLTAETGVQSHAIRRQLSVWWVKKKMALGQAILRILRFSPISIILPVYPQCMDKLQK